MQLTSHKCKVPQIGSPPTATAPAAMAAVTLGIDLLATSSMHVLSFLQIQPQVLLGRIPIKCQSTQQCALLLHYTSVE